MMKIYQLVPDDLVLIGSIFKPSTIPFVTNLELKDSHTGIFLRVNMERKAIDLIITVSACCTLVVETIKEEDGSDWLVMNFSIVSLNLFGEKDSAMMVTYRLPL